MAQIKYSWNVHTGCAFVIYKQEMVCCRVQLMLSFTVSGGFIHGVRENKAGLSIKTVKQLYSVWWKALFNVTIKNWLSPPDLLIWIFMKDDTYLSSLKIMYFSIQTKRHESCQISDPLFWSLPLPYKLIYPSDVQHGLSALPTCSTLLIYIR